MLAAELKQGQLFIMKGLLYEVIKPSGSHDELLIKAVAYKLDDNWYKYICNKVPYSLSAYTSIETQDANFGWNP